MVPFEDKEFAFKVLADGVLIHTSKMPRQGWVEQFRKIAAEPTSKEEQAWLEADLVTLSLSSKDT